MMLSRQRVTEYGRGDRAFQNVMKERFCCTEVAVVTVCGLCSTYFKTAPVAESQSGNSGLDGAGACMRNFERLEAGNRLEPP